MRRKRPTTRRKRHYAVAIFLEKIGGMMMRRIGLMGLMGLMVIFGVGCSRLRIEREYDGTGIVREDVTSYGFFVKRGNQLRLDKSEDALSGTTDIVESAIDEDPSPGNEAMRQLVEMFKLGAAAGATGGMVK